MSYQKKTLILFFLISLLGLASNPSPSRAIGQVTEPIVIKSAMRGQSATATLTVLNSESKEIKVDLKAEGQIASWASFYDASDKNMANPISQLLLPIETYKGAIVKFEIPKDAPNGVYKGVVAVSTIPGTADSANESSSSISQRIDREVSITVSDQEIIAFNISVIPSSYDLAKAEPLKIRIIYDNQGNVAIGPDVQLKISRDGQSVYNVIFPYPEDETAVRPQEIKELSLPIEWATAGQPDGKYHAELKFLVNGKAVKENDFRFGIGTSNFLFSNTGFLASVAAIGRGNLALGWAIVGGFLILVLIILALIVKKIKFSKNKQPIDIS